MEDTLKRNIEELDGQEKLPKLFTMCSICLKEFTLPSTTGLALPSLIGFWTEALLKTAPTEDGRSYPTITGRSSDGFRLTALLGGIFYKILNRGFSIKEGDPGKDLDPIQQSKEDSHQIDNGMIAYMEDTLKRKIEELDGQGKLPKLFTIYSIIKEQSREQLGEKIG
ncbi:hypothetical protein M9H77_22034 [Catharanthus roseus]|uniref:Uncharacterized protein n=1 Tax=Catharanthus roseus TaxID=4058 RepID=A0ACC0APQ4_CATRO|nr:hypothetical protein M9H77_22034 [Catharanthus roseus]